MKQEEYDVFVSYRREGGSEFAKLLRDSLTERGYRVFLDVESLRSGPFNEALYRVIEGVTDVLLILPPNGLDRCRNEDDWVRLEIEYAHKIGKNIVPIMLKGFEFPADLPKALDYIRFLNGPTAADIAYYDAYVNRLTEFLHTKPVSKWMSFFRVVAALALGISLFIATYFACYHLEHPPYPQTENENELVSSLISYMTLNITQLDLAGNSYWTALDHVLQFIDGESAQSEQSICDELSASSNEIRGWIGSTIAIPDQLRQQLINSPFDTDDLDAFQPVLVGILNEYADNLDFMCNSIIPNNNLRAEHKRDYPMLLKSWAEIDKELLICNLNETLLPVTSEEALFPLKKEYLPIMSFLFAEEVDFADDDRTLTAREKALYDKYFLTLELYREGRIGEYSNKEQENKRKELELLFHLMMDYNLDTSKIEEQLGLYGVELETAYSSQESTLSEVNMLINLAENRGMDTSELEAMREQIEDNIEAAKKDLSDLERQLAELKRQAYEKFKPSADDDLPTLWGKGKRFLTIHMTEAAAECFALYAEKGEDEDKIAGISGKKFAERCTALGLEGGVVVCLYEENLPHQAVELGDVIYAVEGEPVRNYGEYSAAVAGDGRYTVSILRFTAKGYEQTESVIDTSLGRLGILGLIDEAQ